MKHLCNAESIWAHWEPAILLPTQLSVRSNPGHSPEMRLVAAIFEDALWCVTRSPGTRGGRRRRDFIEACEWFRDERHDWPFAFVNVCDLLGLDAGVVRQRLRDTLHT